MSVREAMLEDLNLANENLVKIYNCSLEKPSREMLKIIGDLVYSAGELIMASIYALENSEVKFNPEINSSNLLN